MGKRRYVDDLRNLDTGTVAGTDGGLTTVTGSLDVCLDLAEAEVESYLGAILSGHLGCIGCVLLRTAEAHLTG